MLGRGCREVSGMCWERGGGREMGDGGSGKGWGMGRELLWMKKKMWVNRKKLLMIERIKFVN